MSNEKQETIADIVAWLRRPREGENAYLTLWRDEIADRIEAAWKREREAALSAPPRNCDRPECATTKSAQAVWRQEDGGKTAYYEWLLETSTKGEAK